MDKIDESEIFGTRLQALIENSKDLIFVKGVDFRYIAASKCYATDCVRCNGVEDVIGKTDFELYEDKSIAEKYREDDEELISSGKIMMEFQEEYPDKNGEKHKCLTSKFLLHDILGKPLAIFGQYHDYDEYLEEEIKRRKEIDNHIIDAFSKKFFAANYADLTTHKFVTIRSMEYAKKMVENCETIEQAFEAFIETLVRPEYQEQMRDFCDSTTIAKRLKGKSQIECEYLSNVAFGWCQASFYPMEWDENGEVTHVLFAVSALDQEIAQKIEEGISTKKDLQALFDVTPSGIAAYKWDGEKLTFLNTNQSYKDLFEYGDTKEGDSPTFTPFHPDDLSGYQNAIKEALAKTQHLEYAFRVWSKKDNRYKWIQNNAIAKPQGDGTALVYAIFTDVTEQKDAEGRITKQQKSLESALNVANQVCCEYDSKIHTMRCLTDNNCLHLSSMTNFPDCIRDISLVHPKDVESLIAKIHSADDGNQHVQCDARVFYNGEYRWYSWDLEPYYDEEKERNIIILNIIDANVRVSSIENYKRRIQAFEKTNEDALCMADVNLTKNQFTNVQATGTIKRYADLATSIDELMRFSSEAVFDLDEKKTYLNLFQHDVLIKRYENGETQIKFQHLYRVNKIHTMMVETVFDLIREPIHGDIVGLAYAKDMSKENLGNLFLSAAMEKDYPMAAVVYADTGEYYLYEVAKGEYFVQKQNYWKAVSERLANCVDELELIKVRRDLSERKVVSILDKFEEYSYAFDGKYRGEHCRLEANFRYADKKHHLLVATLRDITDEELNRKYKYESEHDELTGLYNRKKVFEMSRELLNAHPDEQFVMLHCDIKHFHLYNTFFGEDEGDRLLCEISDLLRTMGWDYDYWTYGRIESDVFCAFFPINPGYFEEHVKYFYRELKKFKTDFPLIPAIGAYWVTDPQMSVEEMFSYATIAAKSGKKNLYGMISRFDEEMDASLRQTQQITSEMHTALASEQFKVYLQPKYSLRSEKMVGAEALVRWKHPERGIISPGIFIPAFEKNGFIAELDKYMWENVCQILRKWQNEGKPMYPISVNVSRVSMYSHATVPFLKSLVERYHLDPKYLELELTESAYIDDPEDLKRMLKELQEYGFKILMDDFGNGYSSLNTLRDLPVDILKLDMRFLSHSINDIRGNAVLASVVRMSKLLSLPIIAEGVETKEQADYLRSIGCEYVQGFLYAKPMPIEEYEKLLNQTDGDQKLDQPMMDEEAIEKLIDDNSAINLIQDALPISFAIIEYENGNFHIGRANSKFFKQFHLVDDYRPASVIIKEKIDNDSYERMMNAFQDAINQKETIQFVMNWNGNEGEEHLLCSVEYATKVDQVTNYLMMTVINMKQIRK